MQGSSHGKQRTCQSFEHIRIEGAGPGRFLSDPVDVVTRGKGISVNFLKTK